jgi:hypothetical protein
MTHDVRKSSSIDRSVNYVQLDDEEKVLFYTKFTDDNKHQVCLTFVVYRSMALGVKSKTDLSIIMRKDTTRCFLL